MKIIVRRKTWTLCAASCLAITTVGITVAAAAPGSKSSSTAANSSRRVASALRSNFAVFRRASDRHSLAADPISQYPALQQEVNEMMSPSDPSFHLQLNFDQIVEETLPAGPELLIPGVQGACVLMQVPAGRTSASSQVEAIGTCGTTANITASGGLDAEYSDLQAGISIAYGMTDNQVATIRAMGNNGPTQTEVEVTANGYAIRVAAAGRLVFLGRDSKVVRVEQVGSGKP